MTPNATRASPVVHGTVNAVHARISAASVSRALMYAELAAASARLYVKKYDAASVATPNNINTKPTHIATSLQSQL